MDTATHLYHIDLGDPSSHTKHIPIGNLINIQIPIEGAVLIYERDAFGNVANEECIRSFSTEIYTSLDFPKLVSTSLGNYNSHSPCTTLTKASIGLAFNVQKVEIQGIKCCFPRMDEVNSGWCVHYTKYKATFKIFTILGKQTTAWTVDPVQKMQISFYHINSALYK